MSVERAARNEAVFRAANEGIENRLNELSVVDGRSPFLCECDDESCVALIRLTLTEYEHVRANPRRFVVVPGHRYVEATVVSRDEQYEVIEKHGKAGEIAEETDPRSPGG